MNNQEVELLSREVELLMQERFQLLRVVAQIRRPIVCRQVQ